MIMFNNLLLCFVLLCLAVQCIYGLSDTASAGEAEDQEDERPVGWNCTRGRIEGSSFKASERGIWEHAKICILTMEQVGASSEGSPFLPFLFEAVNHI